MQAMPLPKTIFAKATELGVTSILLQFSGGDDEGDLTVHVDGPPWGLLVRRLVEEIEHWAWGVYEYNGAGDGARYGDTITYDLDKKEVTSQEWYERTETVDGETESHPWKLSVDKDED